MKQSTVVIGANFGDEAKGAITDFEVRRQLSSHVVRFNGGAQAGHTVTTDGLRHVFGHVGSGTFGGADTYLSSKFIVNPFVLGKELAALQALGFTPTITAHDDARMSTLYDMALNSVLELARGDARHGSCGMGINETVTRGDALFSLTIKSILNGTIASLAAELQHINTVWVPRRLAEYGIAMENVPEPYAALFAADNYSDMATRMIWNANALNICTGAMRAAVFEGAQGLALDEHLGVFPHVTRSMTGLPYAIVAAAELNIETLQPVYVTRSYLTRHGAGHLEFEGVDFGGTPVDATNIPNDWQGTLRFAPLNLQMLKHYIGADIQRGTEVARAHGIALQPATLALTCMDQLGSTVSVVDVNGTLKTMPTYELPALLTKCLGYHISHMSLGPKASDVQFFQFGV